jgi:AcrR family transcriptional regulator
VSRPQRADARRNAERLIAVAREAFQQDGVSAPLDDIARRAGVGPGTLYRHFPTRDALLAAVYRDDVAGIAARADELAAGLPPMEALTTWLREQLDYMPRKLGLGAAIKVMLGNDTDTMDWCRDTMRAAVGRLLEAAQREGLVRADIDAATLLRLVHGVGLASETEPDRADLMLSIVVSGLRP